MKIRQGFVSNSSTTSFCIYGVSLDMDEVLTRLGLDEESDDPDEDIYEALADKLDMEFNDGTYCLGVSVFTLLKDKSLTIKQAEEAAEKKIKDVLGDGLHCELICDAFYS